jgi:hypothetical protein
MKSKSDKAPALRCEAMVRWRWTSLPPTKPGIYDFRCDETDRVPERVKVKIMHGQLYVECPEIGEVLVDTYHYNLGDPRWRAVPNKTDQP